MVVLLPDKLAVHDVTNGSVLWQAKHSSDIKRLMTLFINAKITGFVSRVSPGQFKGEIFDTATGEFITYLNIVVPKGKIGRNIIRTKGKLMCYIQNLDFHVIRVSPSLSSQQRKREYKFSFPVEHFKEDIENFYRASTRPLVPSSISLLGFLGRSNILLSQLRCEGQHKPLLVSLDIDAAIAATNDDEVQLAFSLPLLERDEDFSFYPCDTGYTPIYMTDKSTRRVDIFGVTCPTWKNSYKNYNFVTEMEFLPLIDEGETLLSVNTKSCWHDVKIPSNTYDWVLMLKDGEPIPSKDSDDEEDLQTKLELDVCLQAIPLIEQDIRLPDNFGFHREPLGSSRTQHLVYKLSTKADHEAMKKLVFDNMRGPAWDRIKIVEPESLV